MKDAALSLFKIVGDNVTFSVATGNHDRGNHVHRGKRAFADLLDAGINLVGIFQPTVIVGLPSMAEKLSLGIKQLERQTGFRIAQHLVDEAERLAPPAFNDISFKKFTHHTASS